MNVPEKQVCPHCHRLVKITAHARFYRHEDRPPGPAPCPVSGRWFDSADPKPPLAEPGSDTWFIQEAKRIHEEEGEIEIDAHAKISRGADNGAYVQAWVWVPLPDLEDP